MKKTYLVLPALVAVLTLFSATIASAACPEGLPAGWCFEDKGIQVIILTDLADPPVAPDPKANFPIRRQTGVDTNGNPIYESIFRYQLKTTSGKQINFVDMLIPFCNPELGPPYNPTGGIGSLKQPGYGDPNTGFGLGLPTYSAYIWKYSGGSTGTVSFALPGEVFAYPNALFLNRGTGNYVWGQILSPACGQLPYHEFIPQVPQTMLKEVNVMGVDLCIVSDEETGCPTKVFHCSDSSYSACSCPTTSQVVWNKSSILDFDIPPGKLRQAWSEHDARCPRTYWHTEGSCRLYQSSTSGYGSTYTFAGISGYVRKSNNLAFPGVTVNACPPGGGTCQTPVQTDGTGYYSVCFPSAPWSGSVTFSKGTCSFNPANPPPGGPNVGPNYSGVSTTNSFVNQNYKATATCQ